MQRPANRRLRAASVALVAMVVLSLSQLVLAGRQAAQLPLQGKLVEAGTGAPIPNASIRLIPESDGAAVLTETDNNGLFQVQALAGRYALVPSKPGFFAVNRPEVVNLEVRPDTRNVQLSLARGLAITGRLLDSKGQPSAGATVIALRVWYDNGRRVLRPPLSSPDWNAVQTIAGSNSGSQVTTDESGRYRLFGLDPGEYYLGIWARQHQKVVMLFYPGVTTPSQAVPIRVTAGNDVAAGDIVINDSGRYSASFKVPLPCRSLAFHLIQGRSEGLEITVLHNASPDQVYAALTPSTQVTGSYFSRTGADSWRVDNLSPGAYDIYHTSCAGSGTGSSSIGRLAFSIVDRDIDAGVMNMQDALPLEGRVTLTPAASGLVKLVSGRGVFPYDYDDRSPLFIPSLARFGGERYIVSAPYVLAADGTFTIPAFPGVYGLNIVAVPESVFIASIKLGGREIRDTGFEFDGASPGPVEILLDGPNGSVEGFVQNSKAEPVGGVQVVLVPGRPQRRNMRLYKKVESDPFGRFTIRGVTPGDYKLLAWEDLIPGAYTNAEFMAAFEQRGSDIQIGRGSVSRPTLIVISAR